MGTIELHPVWFAIRPSGSKKPEDKVWVWTGFPTQGVVPRCREFEVASSGGKARSPINYRSGKPRSRKYNFLIGG